MAVEVRLKSWFVKRALYMAMLGILLSGGSVLGGTQPPLGQVPVPVPRSNAELANVRFGGPNGLSSFVKDVPSAIVLGKALFWDMQAGSDGLTACASCHYRAGADPITVRSRNQLNPGPDSIFGNNSTVVNTASPVTGLPVTLRAVAVPQFAADYTLLLTDFPLFQLFPVTARLIIDPLTGLTTDPVFGLRDTNDVVGSQGVRRTDFIAVATGSETDSGTAVVDQVFHTGAAPNSDPNNNTRQVTGRNAPSVINAVFNYSNFWDGRANSSFNGATPYGPLDQGAGVWFDSGSGMQLQKIAIANSSLASQATASPVSDVDMSYKGRTFPELGRKMLSLQPLKKQRVHPSDSVLGPLSKASLSGNGTVTGNTGISRSYAQLIQDAFLPYLWDSADNITLLTQASPAGEPFSQMEANFSLFWGLAIQFYEATLVSDLAPFDQYQAGNTNSLSPDQVNFPNIPSAVRGFALFDSKCALCHTGSEFTSATTGVPLACPAPNCNPSVFTTNSNHRLIQQEINLNTFTTTMMDTGFMNIGVRTTTDDPGRGVVAPFINSMTGLKFPLSYTRLAGLDVQGSLPFATPAFPPGIAPNTPDAVQGTFKVPGLRNVELTPPYFHNGDAFDLDQVVLFYTRGGDFPNNPELDAVMQPIRNLRGNTAKQADLVEFLKALTDDRVRNETGPFDHPELFIPSGDPADTMISLSATGGSPPMVAPNLTLAPVISPSSLTSQLFSGTVDPSATVQVQVNNLAPLFATVTGSAWNISVTGLKVGSNTISLKAATPTGGLETLSATVVVLPTASIFGLPPGGKSTQTTITLTIFGEGVLSYRYSLDGAAFTPAIAVATPLVLVGLTDALHTIAAVAIANDGAGNPLVQAVPTTAIWTVKATPPLLTINPIITPSNRTSQTVSGTVELGSVPSVTVNTTAAVGPVVTVGADGIGTWSCEISGLVKGVNTITVTALDFVFNQTTKTAAMTIVAPDGDMNENGFADLSDALKSLRISVGFVQPSVIDMAHGDVAPLVNGVPAPDNTITIADALIILKKVVGLI